MTDVKSMLRINVIHGYLNCRFKNMVYLSVCFCEHISEKSGIELLGQLHALVSLDISGCNCSDEVSCVQFLDVISYRIFRTIGHYFFSLKSWSRPILQMRPIYCFMKFRDLKITCNLIQIWKIMQITSEIYCKSISAHITWNRCSL
jgi:hypothetical protein